MPRSAARVQGCLLSLPVGFPAAEVPDFLSRPAKASVVPGWRPRPDAAQADLLAESCHISALGGTPRVAGVTPARHQELSNGARPASRRHVPRARLPATCARLASPNPAER